MKKGGQNVYLLLTLFIVAVLALFSGRMFSYIGASPFSSAIAVQPDEFRGSSVEKETLSFTLSFEEHNILVSALAKSLPYKVSKNPMDTNPGFSEIYLYRFHNQPPLVVSPVGYVENNLVFTCDEWQEGALLIETSQGVVQTLLQQAVE